MGSITLSVDKVRAVTAAKIREELFPDLVVDDAVRRFVDDRIDNYEKEKKHYV